MRVTRGISGPSNSMSKLMILFISTDSMVGGGFEQGLANLKRIGEAFPYRDVAGTRYATFHLNNVNV